MKRNNLIFVASIFFIGSSCNSHKKKIEKEIAYMQNNIDSACFYYSIILDNYKIGVDNKKLVDDNSKKIKYFHDKYKNSFDSLTKAYQNGTAPDSDYENIMQSIKTDSIVKKIDLLQRLGVSIKL